MAGRRLEREQSWDSLRRSDVLADEDGYFQEQEIEDGQEPALMTLGEVHRVLHPLKETADRVGRQVESFAEALDRLNPRRKGKKNIQVKDVLPLVRQYEKIAATTVQQLKQSHERERQEMLQKSFSRRLRKESGLSTPTDYYQEEPNNPHTTTVEDLNHWEQERQTWQLLALMMQAQSSAMDTNSSDLPPNLIQPRNIPRPHRYSTERAVWDYYLEQKPEMWEKHVVVEWLKSNAMNSGQDIDSIVDQLQSGDERGTDLWNSGWLYSKEAIKHQKRLRSWPQPLDPSSAAVGSSLIQAGTSEGQITQLDPDAFSRQGRLLAKEDIFLERATWLACWEMIRRGYSGDDIRTWSKDHRELWRSLSLCGDPRPAYDSGQSNESSSWQSRTLWRRMCFKLSRDGGMDEYERAVYGALSGDLASVQKVARSWDDMLFAYYNSQLLQGFDLYVQTTFPERVQGIKIKGRANDVPPSPALDAAQIWDLLLQSQMTKKESQTPLKLLQGSIIAKRAGSYLVAQAYDLSQVLSQGDPEAKKLARVFDHAGSSYPTASMQLSSYDLLRLFTHVAFVLQDIGELDSKAPGVEQIVVAYVDFLGKAGKQQLLPLYASRLMSDGAIECMARQLPSLGDHNERKTMLNLMHQYSMDVPATLLMQLVLITQDHPVDVSVNSGYPRLRILDSTSTSTGSLPNIKSSFMGDEISGEEWDLISGMEWYLLLDKHWKETMYAGSLVYKYLFLTGSLAAARELSRRVPFRIISLNKTERILGESVDLGIFSDDDTSAPPSPDKRRRGGADGRQGAQPTAAQRSSLLSESSTFRDLEALIRALDAIEHFASIAAQRASFGSDARHAKEWKDQLQTANDAASAAVEPLLEPGWLAAASTPREMAELAALRAAYLPELLLAYISMLGVCGQVLSRDLLLRGLDLAALIAGSGDEGAMTNSAAKDRRGRKTDPDGTTGELARCFVRAGRMAELVDALTALSHLVVMADEAGGRKSRRSGRRSTKAAKAPSDGLGIWSVHSGARVNGE